MGGAHSAPAGPALQNSTLAPGCESRLAGSWWPPPGFRCERLAAGVHAPAMLPAPTHAACAPTLPACACPQPKVYNRDGKELGEMPKGDMYIRDLKNTKGGA